MEFNKVLDTFSNHSTTIINYFEERLTNASAESFNAKIKAFRSQLRGVADGNSSCSDWLGYTLKRKLANRENPLTPNSELTQENTKKTIFSDSLFCDRDRIQTCNRLIRSQLLYSVELRGLFV